MYDNTELYDTVATIIEKVQDNNLDKKRYLSELYSTMLKINQLFGQEMEQWLLKNHYKLEGQK